MPAEHPAPLALSDHPKLVAFGKYLLLDRIAIGGMAEVWLGKTMDASGVSDLLAIKRLLSKFGDDDEFLTMFVDEARIAGQLHHPGIVPIHELGRIGSSMYIAMEFVWGRDLLGILRRLRELARSFEAPSVAYIGARLAEALHYAHHARDRDGQPLHVVHRDVSPQNVIVSFDGKVKLIDFGIAKAATRSTRTQAGTLKGKVGYMSPEQVRGGNVDHRSDQFALGTCLHEMLTGRPLFSRANNYESMELVRDADAPPLTEVAPQCPPRLAEIVHKALSKDPDRRYPTAHELQKQLSLFLAEVDPGYERFTLVTWLRSLFKDEMLEEKRRLDVMDLIGRTAPAPAGKRRANASTRLEIGAFDLYDDDEDAETKVFEDSPLSKLEIDVRRVGPYEVFFQKDELVPAGNGASRAPSPAPLEAPLRSGRGPLESRRMARADLAEMGPYPRAARDTDPDARGTVTSESARLGPVLDRVTEPSVLISPELAMPVLRDGMLRQGVASEASDPVEPLAASESLALDPAEINSQVIRALLPSASRAEATAHKAHALDPAEHPARVRRDPSTRERLERGPRQSGRMRSDRIFFAIAAAFMLVVGAGGTYAWLTSAASAAIELRTGAVVATVLLDGRPQGPTPLRIESLPPGRHVVSLIAEGYAPIEREVHLSPGTTAILEVPLPALETSTEPR